MRPHPTPGDIYYVWLGRVTKQILAAWLLAKSQVASSKAASVGNNTDALVGHLSVMQTVDPTGSTT